MNRLNIVLISVMFFSACSHNPIPSNPSPTPAQSINSFEECVAAGNPVMESYPPMCNANGQTFVQGIGNELEMTELIKIDNPRPNQTISSPLTLTGQARGTYFFEATFPVRLESETGDVLAQHYAEAQGEWMTEDFVPFQASLNFTLPASTSRGYLILEKSNPSGLPEHDAALRIPVNF